MPSKFFITDEGIRLPASEKKYLIPFLTSTTKGTKYYQTPFNLKVKKDYLSDKLCQFHQFIDIFDDLGVDTKTKNFIDVGTGNGIIPQTLLLTELVKNALGTDLYSPYEHESASIPLDNTLIKNFIPYLKKSMKKKILSYDNYSKDLKGTAEAEVFRPSDKKISKLNFKNLKKYKFEKVGALSLKKLSKRFDIVYCKGIEHIHNWKLVLKNINFITKKGSYVYLKMRPFHSYLGPHRFATTSIPWGHALLSAKEYKRYIYQFHKERYKKMMLSYRETLSMPRHSTDELIRFFETFNFNLVCLKTETPPYLNKIIKFKNQIKNFDYLIKKKSKATNLDLTCSIHHLVLQKN